MTPPAIAARALAEALLAGDWNAEAAGDRASAVLGTQATWVRALAATMVARSEAPPDVELLDHWIREAKSFRRVSRALRVVHWLVAPGRFRESRWPVVPLSTEGDLAAHLGLEASELMWLADAAHRSRRSTPKLRHYTSRWVAKASGGARLLEAPKSRLKRIQRRILRDVLDRIAAHDAAHGFQKRRSATTYAARHVGRAVVARFDLEDFFATITGPRVRGVFAAAGYPRSVARLLAALTTTRAPIDVLATAKPAKSIEDRRATELRYRTPHLPQGAPTSPALANLVAYRLDTRLTALATRLGMTYTRYADDLAFSGDDARPGRMKALARLVTSIAKSEGFAVHPRKTRVMRACSRQELAGIIVNDKPNLARESIDALKATLHNAARFGPESQNRDGHADFRAHLLGKLAWVSSINPARGDKLRRVFDTIVW